MAGRALVVVVDDDLSVRESLPELLRQCGFSATAFASADDFVASSLVDQTSCLILDIAMPGRSGIELARELARERRLGHGPYAELCVHMENLRFSEAIQVLERSSAGPSHAESNHAGSRSAGPWTWCAGVPVQAVQRDRAARRRQGRARCGSLTADPPPVTRGGASAPRSDRKLARSSSERAFGCSQAAKCPPLGRRL